MPGRLIRYGPSLLAALAVAGGLWWVWSSGVSRGIEIERARQEAARRATQQQLFRLGEELARQAADLARVNRERVELVETLERDAQAAPGADRPGVGATGGLRRLQQRWGTP